jgi:hypothetical protein
MSNTSKGDEIVRSLYKSSSSCADHHDTAFLKGLHIRTAIDDAITLAARQNKIVIVTGNPGDGKTHLIRRVQDDFPAKARVNEDANQREDQALIKELDEAYQARNPFVLAINEGVLLSICEQARAKSVWAKDVIHAILRPYVYDDEVIQSGSRLLVLDLNLRNNLARDIVRQAIEKVVSLADNKGALSENATRLKNPLVVERLIALLDAVGRTGYHATMRDLLGFIAYLLCGGEEEPGAEQPRPYYVNAFVGGIGRLFEQVRAFDPLASPAPFLDDRLYMCLDEDDEWELDLPSERRDKENIEMFKARKRRAYFEHSTGASILRAERSDIAKTFASLNRAEQAPEHVAIRLLNRFFEAKETSNDNLTLWVGHQYWAKPLRYVAARNSVSSNDLVVRVPRLPPHLVQAFSDHYPDHVILIHRSAKDLGDGLVINRSMVAMLLAGDRTSGIGTRNAEALAKIASFYDRLAKSSAAQNVVQILRLDNAEKVRIGVQMDTRTYFIPGGG